MGAAGSAPGRVEAVMAGPHSIPDGVTFDGVAVMSSRVVEDVVSRFKVVLVPMLCVAEELASDPVFAEVSRACRPVDVSTEAMSDEIATQDGDERGARTRFIVAV